MNNFKVFEVTREGNEGPVEVINISNLDQAKQLASRKRRFFGGTIKIMDMNNNILAYRHGRNKWVDFK